MKRRRKKKIVIPPKVIFIFLAALCCILMFLSYRFSDTFAPVKTAIGNIITPMQKGINSVGQVLSDKLKSFSDTKALLDENEKYKKELVDLKNQNQALMLEKYELDKLRDLFGLDEQYVDYPKVAARVIARDTNSSYYNVFTIDKGSEDGIEVNHNVMAGNGLAGIVTEVGKNWATVRSIIDDTSSVSSMFLKTSDTCFVNGDLELLDSGYIKVDMISMNAEIYEGYEIVTSHISNLFLPGILIGYVSDIKVDSSNMTKEAYLTPVVDFEHLEIVLVITEQKEKIDKTGLNDTQS